jgi:hypothetical protein
VPSRELSFRIFIENPPPFKQAPRGPQGSLVNVPIAEGLATARRYLAAGLPLAGLHHSDLDRYEARRLRGDCLPDRYDSFEYVRTLNDGLDVSRPPLIPHRVVIYKRPEEQAAEFRGLAEVGIRSVVLVGRPYSVAPTGVVYRSTVEQVLSYLRDHVPDLSLNLGVIGIHTRVGEIDRIVRKFEAAGGRLQVMGQFLDDVERFIRFMDDLTHAFEARGLDLGTLKWNVGLAIFALGNRAFYAQLLRADQLACENRFAGLHSMEDRIAASIDMNIEFAGRAREHCARRGFDVGFSIQPLIERRPDGTVHPAVDAAIELARRLRRTLA